ncbi:MAG TPA: aminotransferase class I/II-fold pyridoxal phosphate-dependent enzyme [Desulfosporosinus sp.]|nr:aminotransferase class I/II-fold pyridoxal phosphate-dependent enzyme [Desulfosporosinus sp.]
MLIENKSLDIFKDALELLEKGFQDLPEYDSNLDIAALRKILLKVAERMQNNFPYPHPMYAGQMLKPPHPIARLAYALSLWINPNNHALDGGIASSMMEKEAITELARMFSWKNHLGHICSGGTMANLEALWIAGNLQPGKKVIASQQAHYTHERICAVLKIPFDSVPCDNKARMDLNALKVLLEKGDIGTVVVTIGTTATGSVDPLEEIINLQLQYGFRIHADAAYGGFYILTKNLYPETLAVFSCLPKVDSIVIDPHKHGLQPYGCGCVLFRDPAVGRFYQHDSPYTYFSSNKLHLGEISLECSRPGASAVALWATQQLLPFTPGGVFANDLEKSRKAAIKFAEMIQNDLRFMTAMKPELDIVVWAPKAKSASEVSYLSKAIFKESALRHLHLALVNLPTSMIMDVWRGTEWDQDTVTCLRSCLMKPEHLDWIDRIWQALDSATFAALKY